MNNSRGDNLKINEVRKRNFIGSYDAIPSPIDKRDYVVTFIPTDQVQLPNEYTTPNLTQVLNQGTVGSCVAHATDSMFEYLNQLHNKKYQRFSPGFIYAHKSNKNESGMIPREAVKFICQNGNVFQDDFPYNYEVPNIFTQYEKSGGDSKLLLLANQHKEALTYFQLKTQQDIKADIYKYGYCIACIPIHEDTQVTYEFIDQDPKTLECKDYNAIFEEGTMNIIGYHMICLVGWSNKHNAYLMQNSWGNWAKSGFAFLPYDFTIEEAWGCSGYTEVQHEDVPTPNPIIHKKSDNLIVQFIWKVINFFINLFAKH